MSELDQLLSDAAEAHRAGRLQEATEGYLAVLQQDPDHADALQLLGMVAARTGRPGEALQLLERALASDPEHEVAHANRALVLHGLERMDEAREAARQALALRPGFVRPAFLLGSLARDREELAEAVTELRRAREENPGQDHIFWHGVVPHTRKLVQELLAEGHPDRALGELRVHFSFTGGSPSEVLLLVDVLAQHPAPPTDLGALLLPVYDSVQVDLQRIERTTRRQLEALPAVAEALARLPDPPLEVLVAAREALEADALCHPWLRRTIVTSVPWEQLFVALRSHLLAAGDPALAPHLTASLATQAWLTEYAWRLPPGDLAAAQALPPEATTLRALVAPLSAEDDPSEPADPDTTFLVELQLSHPAQEAALAAAIPSLGEPKDPVSKVVAAQYEANPYPRLVHVHQRGRRQLNALLDHLFPHAAPFTLPPRPRVLVAGAGSGQHPLSTATRLQGAHVVALDLSRASLGRAAREAQVRGITELEFVQGDLLDLSGLEGTFDLIESGGVLHHLASPEAGLRSLLTKLAPGGLMRLGLYSERGRTDVVAARDLAAEHGWTATPEGIRQARQELMALPPQHPAWPLRHSSDFYSISGARDLFLHAQEHRFRPLELRDLLARCGLEFLGFQHGQASVAAAYRARFPEDEAMIDLARWDAFEQDHPRSFSGMYQLWCRPRR